MSASMSGNRSHHCGSGRRNCSSADRVIERSNVNAARGCRTKLVVACHSSGTLGNFLANTCSGSPARNGNGASSMTNFRTAVGRFCAINDAACPPSEWPTRSTCSSSR